MAATYNEFAATTLRSLETKATFYFHALRSTSLQASRVALVDLRAVALDIDDSPAVPKLSDAAFGVERPSPARHQRARYFPCRPLHAVLLRPSHAELVSGTSTSSNPGPGAGGRTAGRRQHRLCSVRTSCARKRRSSSPSEGSGETDNVGRLNLYHHISRMGSAAGLPARGLPDAHHPW